MGREIRAMLIDLPGAAKPVKINPGAGADALIARAQNTSSLGLRFL
jgi:hypothetical protein